MEEPFIYGSIVKVDATKKSKVVFLVNPTAHIIILFCRLAQLMRILDIVK